MSLRTRPEGYGLVATTLHWATVAALVAQVVIGYSMDWDDSSGGGRGRGRGRGGDSGRGRGGDGGDDGNDGDDGVEGWAWPEPDDTLVWVHVALGLGVVALGLARLAWRRWGSLPTWAEQLSAADRRLATWTERVLLALLVVVPLTGVALILSGDDDLLWLHVAGHVALYIAVATHLWLVLRRRLLHRMVPRVLGRTVE